MEMLFILVVELVNAIANWWEDFKARDKEIELRDAGQFRSAKK